MRCPSGDERLWSRKGLYCGAVGQLIFAGGWVDDLRIQLGNQTLAASALAMLAQLIRYGRIAHHGAFYNAQKGKDENTHVN
jgi:hypothetical protein